MTTPKIPTHADIEREAIDNVVVWHCLKVQRGLGLTDEQLYRLCIVKLIERIDALTQAEVERVMFSSAPVVIGGKR